MEQNQNELLAEAIMRRLGLSDKEPSEEEKKYDETLSKAIEEYEKGKKYLFTNVMDIPEVDWLVEGFAVEEGLTLLFGDAGVGKTSLMLQLMGCLTEGKEFLGLVTKKVETLLIEQDESRPLLRGHVERMLSGYPSLKWTEVPNFQILWDGEKMDFQYADYSLKKLIGYFWHPIVIIDSLTSLGIEDINHPASAILFDKLRQLAGIYHCAFILLHHPNKSGDVMGSNLIKAKVDCMLHLQSGRLSFEKLRGKTPESVVTKPGEVPYLSIRQDPDTLIFSEVKGRVEFIQELLLQGKPRPEIIEAVCQAYGGRKASVARAVDREKEKLIESEKLISFHLEK